MLRAFRLLRVFKLLRSWTSLQRLLTALLSLASDFLYLMLLLALILFIFALLGMQLFGGRFVPPAFPELPRTHFESIDFAMLTVFVVACGEAWNEVWVDTKVAVGASSFLFFSALVICANYMLLNLVVALLIGSFDGSADDPPTADGRPPPRRLSAMGMDLRINTAVHAADEEAVREAARMAEAAEEEAEEEAEAQAAAQAAAQTQADEEQQVEVVEGDRVESEAEYLRHFRWLPASMVTWLADQAHDDRVCWLLGPEHRVRMAATALVAYTNEGMPLLSFDNLIVVVILLSSATMSLESCTLEPESAFAGWLRDIDAVVMSVFVLELLAKVRFSTSSDSVLLSVPRNGCLSASSPTPLCAVQFAPSLRVQVLSLGLAFSPRAYLASGWNRLDGFIVIASLISSAHSSPAFRALRLLRVLRPLRLISRFEGMRTAVQLLLRAMPRVFDVFLVSALFLDVFAILGVQMFGGRFGRCADAPSLTSRAACEGASHEWSNPAFGHFDNVWSAMLLLFEMASLEGWTEVMFAGVDAVGVGVAPVRDHAPSHALFFILWILLGSLCLLNLVVGVLVSTFHDIKRLAEEACERGIVMTEKQRAWVDVISRLLGVVKPRPRAPCPSAPWRAWCHRLATWPPFESVMLVVIVFNTVLMALDGYGLAPWQAEFLVLLNDACTLLFLGECIVKLAGLGPPVYFQSAWNGFDFSIVLLALCDWTLTAFAHGAQDDANPTLIRAIRMVRVTRVLRTVRVVRSARGLKLLLTMLLYSLPTLGNVLGLYLVLTCMYSLLGMQLFGHVRHGVHINEHANFCTFGDAFLAMFRCATGESWNGMMHEAAQSAADGLCSEEEDDCGTWLAVPFFVSYVILSTFIVIKMMIVLIIENFTLALKRDRNALQPESADVFIDVWGHFDPDATGRIHVKHLVPLLRRLPPPLGLDPQEYPAGHVTSTDVTRYAYQMDVRPRASRLNGQPEVWLHKPQSHLACYSRVTRRDARREA